MALHAQPRLCCAASAMRAAGACACVWGHASVPLHPLPSYYVPLCARGSENLHGAMPHCYCSLLPGHAWMRQTCQQKRRITWYPVYWYGHHYVCVARILSQPVAEQLGVPCSGENGMLPLSAPAGMRCLQLAFAAY